MSERIVVNAFDRLKAKVQNRIRTELNFEYLRIADEAMFNYGGGFPFDRHFVETYLTTTGSAGIKKIKSEFYICPDPSRVGDPDQYGDGTELEGVTADGEQDITGTIGEDCAIMYNNSVRSPDFDNFTDSSDLAQIEKSSGINVKLSRVAPIFTAPNTTVKAALDEMLKRVLEGELLTVVSENTAQMQALSALSKMPTNPLEAIDITKPERIQYVQYLSELYDQIVRRHFGRRGLSAKTSAKHAQVSQDEVHGLDCISWFYPLDKLKARRDALETCNRIFGTSWTVEFSEIWKQEYESYVLRTLQRDAEAEQTAEGSETNAEEVTAEGRSDANSE